MGGEESEAFFSIFGENGSAIDAVWRQCVVAEAAGHGRQFCATLLWDLTSFYEYMDRHQVQEQALAAHIPHQIVRCSLQMYGSFRYVSYCNVVVAAYYPRSGVVAGCAHATMYVQVYGGPHYESFVLGT